MPDANELNLRTNRNWPADEPGCDMTTTYRRQPIEAETVDDAVEAMRDLGLRITAARRLVLESLFAAQGPLSAERIAAGAVGRVPRLDLASVYRNLETLEEIGLVRHVHLGHGPGLYALAHARAREYLVCESCDTVVALEPAELDGVREAVRRIAGFEARFGHFPIVGLCPRCADETDDQV
jgi:Fur family ferric uptake transcriptional regulator